VWAWSTPSAAGWSAGDLYAVARRARLEDRSSPSAAVLTEMRQLDHALGLTPKGLAGLRWFVVADEPAPKAAPRPSSRRLKVVDAHLFEGNTK
jgi:hypothetical protein